MLRDTLRDVLLCGTASFVIIQQAYRSHPNEFVLAAAVALTSPTLILRTRELYAGHGTGHGSPSRPESPQGASSSSPEGGAGE